MSHTKLMLNTPFLKFTFCKAMLNLSYCNWTGFVLVLAFVWLFNKFRDNTGLDHSLAGFLGTHLKQYKNIKLEQKTVPSSVQEQTLLGYSPFGCMLLTFRGGQNFLTYVDQLMIVSLLKVIQDRRVIEVGQVGHVLSFLVLGGVDLAHQIFLEVFDLRNERRSLNKTTGTGLT